MNIDLRIIWNIYCKTTSYCYRSFYFSLKKFALFCLLWCFNLTMIGFFYIGAWSTHMVSCVYFEFNWLLVMNKLLQIRFWNEPFPSYRRFCSRRLFENIVTKEEIAQNVQFLLLPQCFPLLVIGYPFNYKDFLFFGKTCSKSSAAELSYEGKG